MPPTTSADAPIVVIGIDAGDIHLIEHWAEDGHLPTFAGLFESAAHGRLDTTSQVLQGSIWNSFATSCHPGKHGSYYRLQMRSGKNEIARIRADHCFRLPFWAWFGGGGETAVIVDVPKIAPLPAMNGLQVVEWGAFDHYWQHATSPRDAQDELIREFSAHPLLDIPREPRGIRACMREKARLIEGVRMKHRLNVGLLRQREPRVLVSVFGETHFAGHYFWRFWDRDHPRHERHPDVASALRGVYVAVDAAIGDLIDACSERTILIVSGHGIGPDYNPHYVLPDLLRRMGMTVQPDEAGSAGPPRPAGMKARVKRALRNALPGPMRRALVRRMIPAARREQLQLRNALRDIDFGRSKAFCLPTDLQGLIRINLQGREPTGVVAPEEYDAVCDELEAELHSLENAADGEPVVERVFRTRELYGDGDQVNQLPDLCVLWKSDRPVPGVRSPKYGVLEGERRPTERSGNHRPEGFFFALGPGIDATQRGARGHILDVAPTIFRLMGKGIPEDWDGAPLPILGRPSGESEHDDTSRTLAASPEPPES